MASAAPSSGDNTRHILITGATGFIGNTLCASLAKKAKDDPEGRPCVLHVICRKSSVVDEIEALQWERFQVKFYRGNLSSQEFVNSVFKIYENRWEVVYHCAGLIAYQKSKHALMYDANVMATQAMVNAIRKYARGARMLHVSSVAAVGANETRNQAPLNEDTQWNDSEISYLQTKHLGEQIVLNATTGISTTASPTLTSTSTPPSSSPCPATEKEEDPSSLPPLDAVVVCPSNVYGRGDAKKQSRGSQLKAARGEQWFSTPGGVNVLHIDALLEGIFMAVEKGRSGQRYILGGENITIAKLLDMYAEAAQTRKPYFEIPKWLIYVVCYIGELFGSSSYSLERAGVTTMYHWYDVSKARSELGLPMIDSRRAIEESVAWMKENGYLEKQKQMKEKKAK